MLTVLFATRNGAKTLPAVLEAYKQLRSPDSGWKLVVVDNGSMDTTKEIILSHRELLPLTYVFEDKPGKNAALNAGLDYIEGDLAVFTDDDVFPHSNWLIRLRAGADTHRSYSIFGGVILPRWEEPPPTWIEWTRQSPTFALTNPTIKEGPVTDSIYGPNMAIRTAIFEEGARFDVSIGPRGKNYAMGSETELVQRLLRRGHKAWHIHGAVVEHFIRAFQMRKSWVLERAIRFGRGVYRLSQCDERPIRFNCWMGVPRFLYWAILKDGLSVVIASFRLNEKKLFCARWELNARLGQIIEARIISLEQRAAERQ